MAPEQAAGRSDLGPPVDVYATGVILYEMLSGVVPFEAGNYNTIIYKVLAGLYEPLSTKLTGVPAELEAVVNRAMSLQPEQRFASADEFAAALEPFSYGASFGPSQTPMPGPAAAWGVGPSATPRPPSQAPTTPKGEPAAPRRRWLLFTLLGLVLAGAGGTAIVLAAQAGSDTGQDATQPAAAPSAPAAAAQPAAAPTPAPVEPTVIDAKVVIRFEIEPKDAVITADGAPLIDGELVRPMSNETVEIAVSRDGYTSKTRSVSLAESRTIEVILEKPAAPATSAKKRPSSGKKKPSGDGDGKPDRIITDSPFD